MKYFAYGANLHRPSTTRMAQKAMAIGIATLMDHRITIGGAGFATLMPASGQLVYGLLWEITESDERALDEFEGVDRGFYRKVRRPVVTPEGMVEAMLYLGTDTRPGRANPDYVRQILEGASAAGFPAEYLEELARLPQDARISGPWIPPVDV